MAWLESIWYFNSRLALFSDFIHLYYQRFYSRALMRLMTLMYYLLLPQHHLHNRSLRSRCHLSSGIL